MCILRINDNAGLVTNSEVHEAIQRNTDELKGVHRPFNAQEKDESTFLRAVDGYIKRHTNPVLLKDRKKAEEYAKYLLGEGLSGVEIVQFSNFQPLEIVDVHMVTLTYFTYIHTQHKTPLFLFLTFLFNNTFLLLLLLLLLYSIFAFCLYT